ncbi:hypothetical protein CMEL01_07218 [Colletotrichum melonis]|uniref:Uncharacterized protein n=1 Tax=Colletotrichum melonis TaxID=1209925 RepID=A0AAI9XJ06_9PEZI|nr:hypothetical protein CMEL01_07218 [Colletotrichum melonis]
MLIQATTAIVESFLMHSSIGHGNGAGGGLGHPSSDSRQVHRPTSRLPGWNTTMDLGGAALGVGPRNLPSLLLPTCLQLCPSLTTTLSVNHLKSSALFALDGWSDDVTWAVGRDFAIRNVVILISAKRQPQRDDERCHLQMMMGILDLLLRRAPASFPATWAFLPLRNLGNHQTKHPTIICRTPMPHWCRFGLIFPTRSVVLGRISDARAQSAHRKCEAFTHNVLLFEYRKASRRARQKSANQPASFRDIRPFWTQALVCTAMGFSLCHSC